MSDLEYIKKRILREDRVEAVLEALGCEYIRIAGGRVEAQLPPKFHSDNRRAVQCKLNESLSCAIRNRADFKGDIFNLVSYLEFDKRGTDMQKNLHNSKEFICGLFGWNEYLKDSMFKTKKDYVAPLKALMKTKKNTKEIVPNPVIPESMLDEYYPFGYPLPYQSWIDEGISYETQFLYGVGFDLDSKRVIIPMRNRFGQLVGAKGRIMHDEDDDRKYLYMLRFNNRYEWFNFHFAHPYILESNRVYIYEAEKSCLKAHSNGIFNTVAIGASEISDEQIQILKQISLDLEIVLCYDKGIPIDEIKSTAKRFGRKVYAMFDTDEVLEGAKSAPIDEGVDKWRYLEENCIFPIK